MIYPLHFPSIEVGASPMLLLFIANRCDEQTLAEEALRECVDVVLVALFADAKRNDMDNNRVTVELVNDAVALAGCSDRIVIGKRTHERFPPLLGRLLQFVN